MHACHSPEVVVVFDGEAPEVTLQIHARFSVAFFW